MAAHPRGRHRRRFARALLRSCLSAFAAVLLVPVAGPVPPGRALAAPAPAPASRALTGAGDAEREPVPLATEDPADPEPTPAPTTPGAEPTPEPSEFPATPTTSGVSTPPAAPPSTSRPPVVAPPTDPRPAPSTRGTGRLGARVTTGDVTLGQRYWAERGATADLSITVTNTGTARQTMRVAYTLPVGLADAGTAGCVPGAGRTTTCADRTAAPGASFVVRARVRVGPDAWRRMPLSGAVTVTAGAVDRPGSVEVRDRQGFAVLFPPGPPVPGVALAAGEVRFDPTAGADATLEVRLENTGTVAADGSIEVLLPAGIEVHDPPTGCRTAGPARTRCGVGLLPAGRAAGLRLTIAAAPAALVRTPLAGAAVGTLVPDTGRPRRVQMSFRIVLADGPVAAGVAGSSSALPAGVPLTPAARPAQPAAATGALNSTALVGGVVGVVLAALALAIVSLRRRLRADAAE